MGQRRREQPSTRRPERAGYYVAFVGFVTLASIVARPQPDVIPLDYGALASSFCGLLAGLGGFAITILALLLGLDALDYQKSSESRRSGHAAVIRHVSISVAVASVTCFVGAQILGEVSAQNAAIEGAKVEASTELNRYIEASGLTPPEQAELILRSDNNDKSEPYFGLGKRAEFVQDQLNAIGTSQATMAASMLSKRVEALDRTLDSSSRRFFLIALIPALISSWMILQSVASLLMTRFPKHTAIATIQNLTVLGFGSMLLIKAIHSCSYGLGNTEFVSSRFVIAAILGLTIIRYKSFLKKKLTSIRISDDQEQVNQFVPLLPYSFALGACFVATLYLAATFSNTGAPKPFDRWLGMICMLVATGLLFTIQIERPTIQLLED